ncbi:hypothetical protein B0H12DRAFT_378636 [Mycena haematopus]|nr:hypothetical protein B0H12DRAFT_378636 [Mycena haematopus]
MPTRRRTPARLKLEHTRQRGPPCHIQSSTWLPSLNLKLPYIPYPPGHTQRLSQQPSHWQIVGKRPLRHSRSRGKAATSHSHIFLACRCVKQRLLISEIIVRGNNSPNIQQARMIIFTAPEGTLRVGEVRLCTSRDPARRPWGSVPLAAGLVPLASPRRCGYPIRGCLGTGLRLYRP